jgi:hypothetical protein
MGDTPIVAKVHERRRIDREYSVDNATHSATHLVQIAAMESLMGLICQKCLMPGEIWHTIDDSHFVRPASNQRCIGQAFQELKYGRVLSIIHGEAGPLAATSSKQYETGSRNGEGSERPHPGYRS